MKPLSANKAAKEAGIAKKTLLGAINNGRLSAEKNDKGYWEIQPAELFRVFPVTSDETTDETETHPQEKPLETSVLQVELEAVRRELATANLERERERQQLSEQIEHLRGALDKEQATTAMLTDQRDAKPLTAWQAVKQRIAGGNKA
ncbi:hypothetical protein VWY74_01575 [Phaeobacter sp. JH20_24]|uniref:hypothetical protein n=1 Tax=unclassified Phaeobacter TaxID=2621772 RepID=UPI003A8A5E17